MARPKGSKNKNKKTESTKGAYTVFLKVNNEEYSSTSETLKEALLNLPIIKPKTKTEVTVSANGKTFRPVILTIPNMNRLFNPGMTGEIQRAVLVKRYTFAS